MKRTLGLLISLFLFSTALAQDYTLLAGHQLAAGTPL